MNTRTPLPVHRLNAALRVLLAFVWVFGLAAVPALQARERLPGSPGAAVPVIVDTDMGTDDWLALAYMANSARVQLLGVTVVGNGLASCDVAARNVRHILDMAGGHASRPVGCGSVWPMDGYASYPRIWRETGANMMGETIAARAPGQDAVDGPTLLAQLLADSPAPVVILAIGSMTNIATVLKANPALKPKIRRIVSMGGAVRTGGNLRVHGFTDHHSNTRAEWNYYIDPVAASMVFQSGVPILLVPLDATRKVPLTRDFIERTAALRPSALGAFVNRTFQRIEQSTSNGEYYHWDPLTAAVSVHPELCEQVETLPLSVVVDEGRDEGRDQGRDQGLAGGQPARLFPYTNFFGQKRRPLSSQAAGATVPDPAGSAVSVCMHVDLARFERDFLATLRTAP